MTRPTDPRRRIPQVEQLVTAVAPLADGLPRPLLVAAVRDVVESVRKEVRRGEGVPAPEAIEALAVDEARRRSRLLLSGVVNATGVVVHTNLGRVPLAPSAIDAAMRAAGGYSNLEFDLSTGRRGDRYVHVEPMLAVATGAEAALVVNNNAAAVLLVCAALAAGREVVVSRGELIEIGGEFRIPEVLVQSGARMKEVGTTNRTHLHDYERAMNDQTGLVMKVHPSNYEVIGFTTSVGLEELAPITRRAKVPLVFDAGSGLLSEPFADEPFVPRLLKQGADLVCFSGDKLLGGPQAGIVCGRASLVNRMRRHPLLRALRPGKMTIAALTATVRMHLEGRSGDLPVWRMIHARPEDLGLRCDRIVRRAQELGYEAQMADGDSPVGGGSLPGHAIPGPVVRLRSSRLTPARLVAALRAHAPPVIARIASGRVILDLRTVLDGQDGLIVSALEIAAGGD